MGRAFIFPGQGSQAVNMGKALCAAYPVARRVFEEIDAALEQNLSQLMWEGPEDELVRTENAQPALMSVSMAAIRVLEDKGYSLSAHVDYVAGHSLGEYTALAAAGALNIADTARLLKLRGQAMQRAVPMGVGAMAALLGLEFDEVKEIAAKETTGDIVCSAANDNAPGQVVISGHAQAVARAIDAAKQRGAKRAVELPVSAPFHCALMGKAAEEMEQELAKADLRAPCVPVVANVTARPMKDPDEIRASLVAQVTGVVRWRESMMWLAAENVLELVEIGAGKVLSGLARRIDRNFSITTVNDPTGIDAALALR